MLILKNELFNCSQASTTHHKLNNPNIDLAQSKELKPSWNWKSKLKSKQTQASIFWKFMYSCIFLKLPLPLKMVYHLSSSVQRQVPEGLLWNPRCANLFGGWTSYHCPFAFCGICFADICFNVALSGLIIVSFLFIFAKIKRHVKIQINEAWFFLIYLLHLYSGQTTCMIS